MTTTSIKNGMRVIKQSTNGGLMVVHLGDRERKILGGDRVARPVIAVARPHTTGGAVYRTGSEAPFASAATTGAGHFKDSAR